MSCGVDFQQNLGWKSHSDGPHHPAVSKTSVATNSPRTNRNQPLLLFHMDPTNTIVWTRKSVICSVVSCGVDFQQNLGWKSHSDGPHHHTSVSKTSVATDSRRDILTNRNQPLLLFHMDPTNTIVWTRKSFIGSVVSYGLIFSKTWVGNHIGGPLKSAKLLWPLTAPGTK
jgi:hypothetical protein